MSRSPACPCARFNEAGADCPGMHVAVSTRVAASNGFNEAGADCPGMHRACGRPHAVARASMRPGQTAPECLVYRLGRVSVRLGFNEAGADCPGMLARTARQALLALGFNEAGADCPGMRRNRIELTLNVGMLQ